MASNRRALQAAKTVTLNVRVQTRSQRNEIAGCVDGYLKIRTTAIPVGGKANTNVIQQLAKAYQVPQSQISLISGAKHREKVFRITSPGTEPDFPDVN